MNDLKLNTIDGLTKFSKEFNSVIENKINEIQLVENIKKVDELSLYSCVQLFEGISDRLFSTNNGQKCIAKYANVIKSNNDLKEGFIMYKSIKEPTNIVDVNLYICEACDYFNTLNSEKFNKGLKELRNVIKKALKECKISNDLFNTYLNSNKEINDSLQYIFENKKTSKNLNEYTSKVAYIIDYVNENKKTVCLENSESATYSDLKNVFENNDLTSWENNAVEKIVMCNIQNGNKSELFETYKKNCLDLIEESLNDEDITLETKSRLSTMKAQLNEKVYKEDTSNEDILKLANLEYTLLT
jgi:hypothetical protein